MNNDFSDKSKTKKHGFVNCFEGYTVPMLYSMKEDTGLSMPVEQLACVQNYYRKTKRTPTLDVLYLIDRIIEKRVGIYSPISDIITRDPVIADVYSDLMSKRAVLPCASQPPTISSLFSAADAYFYRIGKHTPFDSGAFPVSGRYAETTAAMNGNTRIAENGCSSLYAANGKRGKIQINTGSYIVLLTKGTYTDSVSFLKETEEMFSADVISMTEYAGITDSQGIIGILCRLGAGALLDLASLPGKDTQYYEMTDLCDLYEGTPFAIVPQPYLANIQSRANLLGITASAIGITDMSGEIHITHPFLPQTELDISFIESLYPIIPLRLNLDTENPSTAELPSQNKNSTTIMPRIYSSCDTIMLSGCSHVSSSCAFRDSFSAVIRTAANIIAGGASYKDICLSCELKLPQNAENDSLSDAIKMILGIYRAQIEFYFVSRGNCITYADVAKPELSISAAARIPGNVNLANRTTFPRGSHVYVLSPGICENGNINLRSLRNMWDYASKLVKSNIIISASAISGGGIDKTFEGMTVGNRIEKSSDCHGKLAQLSVPGSIMAITEKNIDGIFIGTSDYDFNS